MHLEPGKILKVMVITWGVIFVLERMPNFRASLFPGSTHIV